MSRGVQRDILLWLIYSIYLLILLLPNLITPENSELSWSEKIIRVCLIIVFLFPSKLAVVYIGLPSFIDNIVYRVGNRIFVIVKLLASIIIGVLLYRLALYFYIYPYLYEKSAEYVQFFSFGRFLSNFADLTVPMLFFGAIWLYDARRKADQEKTELELQFLKNQTSPHFLFNALNSIYGLVRKNDINAAQALLKLSGILRYLLYETMDRKILLEKELEVVERYLDIQRLRFGNTLQLTTSTTQETKQLMISPGLILPLLENAFKFGFSDRLNGIFVDLVLEIKEDKTFSILISNHISESEKNEVGGLGLLNLKRRLEIEYPGTHQFESKMENGMYLAHLKLVLQ